MGISSIIVSINLTVDGTEKKVFPLVLYQVRKASDEILNVFRFKNILALLLSRP